MSPKTGLRNKSGANKLTLVILGDGGVGKSSMTLRFVRKEYTEVYDPTIDDSYTTSLTFDGITWEIEILDTAGQEEYQGLWVEHAISQGDAFILTYSITSKRSIGSLPTFIRTISRSKQNELSRAASYAKVKNSKEGVDQALPGPRENPFPFVIAGNKCDIESRRQVTSAEGANMAGATGGLFYECSAKTGGGVEDVFLKLIQQTIRLRKERLVHRRDPSTQGRAFIPNIGYQQEIKRMASVRRGREQVPKSISRDDPSSISEEAQLNLSGCVSPTASEFGVSDRSRIGSPTSPWSPGSPPQRGSGRRGLGSSLGLSRMQTHAQDGPPPTHLDKLALKRSQSPSRISSRKTVSINYSYPSEIAYNDPLNSPSATLTHEGTNSPKEGTTSSTTVVQFSKEVISLPFNASKLPGDTAFQQPKESIKPTKKSMDDQVSTVSCGCLLV